MIAVPDASTAAGTARTAPSAPPGSRLENALMVLHLAGDLLSNPFHLALFLLTRRAHRRQLARALQDAAA